MSNIQPYTPSAGSGSSPLSPWSSHGRAMSRIVSRAELQVASLAVEAHVESAKLDAIDHVTQRALQGTAMVARDCTVNGVTPIKEEHDEQAG